MLLRAFLAEWVSYRGGFYASVMRSHEHRDEAGFVVKCYHKCRTAVLSVGFWFGITVSYYPEHFLNEKVWPFKLIGKALGLH